MEYFYGVRYGTLLTPFPDVCPVAQPPLTLEGAGTLCLCLSSSSCCNGMGSSNSLRPASRAGGLDSCTNPTTVKPSIVDRAFGCPRKQETGCDSGSRSCRYQNQALGCNLHGLIGDSIKPHITYYIRHSIVSS